VNGDGKADTVGFGEAGVYVSLATSGGHFADPVFALPSFGPSSGGWFSQDVFPRELADVNGDGKADIIGFGVAGAYAAHGNSTGSFDLPTFTSENFGTSPAAGGWATEDAYPRHVAGTNSDHKADIVGFGFSGTYTALSHDLILPFSVA
jgi:hypothetical protein